MTEITDWTYALSKDGKPAAHAEPGEIVKFIVHDCFCGQIQSEDKLAKDVDYTRSNPAAGPLYVEGAEAGDALAVDILDIEVDDHGVVCTINDVGPLWPTCELRTRLVPIREGYAFFKDLKWPIDPMIGVIGTAPDWGDEPTGYVSRAGGNMDSRLIRKGATVWLPVRRPGAMLSMGDLHATMGDGEVSGTGIEIAGEITVRVRLAKDCLLNLPVTETRDAWFVNCNGETCDEAIAEGYKEMQRLISRAYGWDSTDTALYMSIQGFLECNQACLEPIGGGNTFRVGTPKVPSKPRLVG
jgi:amidase